MRSRDLCVCTILRGAAAGVIGGLAASWVMNRFQEAQTRQSSAGGASAGGSGGSGPEEQGDNATVQVAAAISRKLFDHELTDKEKQWAGPAVHYAYGALVGGVYGASAEVWPIVSAGLGAPYAIALFALGDELAVPALGFGTPPTQIPPDQHAGYLSAHLVFGAALDVSRRIARRLL